MNEQCRWVLDTNVLISRLLAPGGVAARAADLALARGVLPLSEATLDEMIAVLGRSKFDPYIRCEDRQRFIALLGGVARLVPVLRHLEVCRDPSDDKFLDVAFAGEADAIISGDRNLLALHPLHGLATLSPTAFLAAQDER
jgi:putative PIN family toxin of toxin-antitoxin system